MKRTVRIGLVGTGEIGQVHAQAHASTAATELCLAAMIQPEVEQRLARQYGAQLYPSLDALLDDASVDAVDICLPNDLHRPFVVRALQAGKHVLCEKPIALTLADADAMLDAAQQANRFLMVGHVLRFWPEYRAAKQAIDAGTLGHPLAISARRMVSLLAGTQGERGWRHDPTRSGGAALDMQIHDLDAFCWFFDARPCAVVARGIRSPDGAWSHIFTHLEFPGGRQAFVEASFMMRGNPIDIFFRVLGTERSLEYTFDPATFALHDIDTQASAASGPSLVLYEWKQPPQPLYVPETDSFPLAFRDEVGYFAECVRTGEPPRIGTADQARQALEIALASASSCETGMVVRW
jgi:UDP-N-acetylglucosamine 3-dehydrogenase